ncbi:MAG: M13 family peptidase [Deltaproteobacteria bacterium]|nr:M13 family peptidase [Deltaproteobacteria bacterium]
MNRALSKSLLAVALLAACDNPKSSPAPAPAPSPSPAQQEPAGTPPAKAPPAAAGKAEIGAWGFDAKGMDATTKPGDSFWQYANGTWVKTTKIPADKSNYGMFTALADKSDERTKAIIEGAKATGAGDEQKIADTYKSFMDEAAIEKKGWEPIKAKLEAIGKVTDAAGVVQKFAEASRQLDSNPFATIVTQDEKNPEAHIANLGQGGLGLPDKDMYDTSKKQFDKVREGYKKYLTTMLEYVGTPDAAKRAAAVYALEEKLAAVHWSRVQNRDPVKTYNKLTVAELEKLAPSVDWKPWLAAVGLGKETAINVNQPSAIAGTAKLVKSEPVAVWRDYLTVRLVGDAAPFLSKKFVDARFEMYGKTLSGTPQNQERWKRGVDLVTGSLGEAVGKIYVAKHFTAATKARADELVKNLLVAMGHRLDGLTWMSAATKAKAKEKLATYNPKIGFPKKWRDYSALKIVAGDVVGNAERTSEFEYNRALAKLGKPVDRDEWLMTPMTVNAYYNPVLNEIVFPAAILQPPFFDPNADDAINYGGIGAVIGHEISHGFDDQGSQYDARGALRNWWTKDDEAKFKAATKKLVEQYNTYCPFPGQCVKGDLTLGENIADLAGLTVAYEAYKLSLGGKPAPVLDGMTGDQRFFLGWAQVWRRLYRDAELQNRLVTDPHSPSEFRTSVVRNLDTWYGAFKVDGKEKLFLAPDQRVKIW